MSNESKYYTPSIEEFKVGFRYELGELMEDNSKNWHKQVFSTADDQMSLGAIERLIKGGYIRVKVLDESDIVECGFVIDTQIEWLKFKVYKHNVNEFYLGLFDDGVVLIYKDPIIDEVFMDYDRNDLFFGTIRNYNELKDVMRMLEICVG
jgi:hypothetical protein